MSAGVFIVVLLLFMAGSVFFVSSEYALVSIRKSKFEAEARRGSKIAKLVLEAHEKQTEFVAGIQIGVTLVGIGMGSVVEPEVESRIRPILASFHLPPLVFALLSIFIITYPLVVLGELVPKYITLQFSDRIIAIYIVPLRFIVMILRPFVWLFQTSSHLVLKLLRIDAEKSNKAMSREELSLLVQASTEEGVLEESHSDVVTKTLRLDRLDAADVMSHRIDVKWIDVETPPSDVLTQLARAPHSRVPVCAGDIDEVVGIAYVHDVIRHLNDPDFSLKTVMRAAVFVPENLTLDKVVTRMQEDKTQILIVLDEYGGTSGLVTLEDVIEEVFGNLEDNLEYERPEIEQTSATRLSVDAGVRYDEILEFLDMDSGGEPDTRTLAQIVIDELERTPKLGDVAPVHIGKIRVEQLAKHRVVRVGVYLDRPRPVDEAS